MQTIKGSLKSHNILKQAVFIDKEARAEYEAFKLQLENECIPVKKPLIIEDDQECHQARRDCCNE